jgi:ABC-type multidrug transport system ATPase subunit
MNYKRAHDATVIMVTHNMEEIARSVDRIILFEKGSIAMEGTPAQVFSLSERLASLGLTAPKVTLVAARLRALGLPIRQDIYTIAQLKQALAQFTTHNSQFTMEYGGTEDESVDCHASLAMTGDGDREGGSYA